MNLVYQLLKRWWYALPKWPPENYDPTPKLNEHKLRVVQLSEYKKEPNIDENNFTLSNVRQLISNELEKFGKVIMS